MLYGPYPIGHVDSYVYDARLGVYVLSRDGLGAAYAGRSDNNLRSRIQSWATSGSYTHFWFGYTATVTEAFEWECRLYHQYTPPENRVHPAAPVGASCRCPVLPCVLRLR